MTSSRDVAKAAGVSQATVSRVIQGHDNVRPETRDRVLQAMRATGFRPNAQARALRTNRSHNVAVVVGRILNPLYPALLEQLGAQLFAAGYRMTIWEAEVGGEEAAMDALSQSLVDGVILTTATKPTPAITDAIKANAPIVLINRTLKGLECQQVASDNYRGACSVAEHFASGGRKRPAVISGPKGPSTIEQREAGYLNKLADLDLRVPEQYRERVTAITHQTGVDAARRLLELPEPPDAVFCANDLIAFAAMSALKERNLTPGKEVWIAGYDDVEMASWPVFDLTTVRQPIGAIAREGTRLLLDQLNGSADVPRTTLLANNLIIRGTSHRRRNEKNKDA